MIRIGQYDYNGLIKSYLAQDRPSASTAGNRMSYSGIKLYSYNSLLARMSDTLPNTLYINKHISRYSRTTSTQIHILQKEALYSWNVFVINLETTFADNLLLYWTEVEDTIKRYNRARTCKPLIKQELHKLIRTAQHFAELHGLDPTIPDPHMRQLFVNQLLI